MHGYGKYTWDGELFSDFVFHIDNTYKGMWKNGERDGFGTKNNLLIKNYQI